MTMLVDYFIQAVTRNDGARESRLYMPARDGRGLIDEPEVRLIPDETGAPSGFVMSYRCKDGITEQAGTDTHPLPMELLNAASGPDGLTVVFVVNNRDEPQIAGGQVLYVDNLPEGFARTPAASPRQSSRQTA